MKIEFTPTAKKEIDKINPDIADRIVDKLIWLAAHPDINVERLKGLPSHLDGLLKYRIGLYRALFWFEDDRIIVYRVGHRSSVYKGLK